MGKSKEFYKRLILSCFSRNSAMILSADQINKDITFTLGQDGIKNIWDVVDEMIEEGYLAFDVNKNVYQMKSYRPKPKAPMQA